MKTLLLATAAALLLSVPAHATLISKSVDIKITSRFGDNGPQCASNCGKGTLNFSVDTADPLDTFQFAFNTEGVIELLNVQGGSGFFDCQAPACGRFPDIAAAIVGMSDPQADIGYIGVFTAPFSGHFFNAETLTAIAHPFEIVEDEFISIDKFGGEWGGEDFSGQSFEVAFNVVPEPSTLSDLLAGFFLVLGFGALRRRAQV